MEIVVRNTFIEMRAKSEGDLESRCPLRRCHSSPATPRELSPRESQGTEEEQKPPLERAAGSRSPARSEALGSEEVSTDASTDRTDFSEEEGVYPDAVDQTQALRAPVAPLAVVPCAPTFAPILPGRLRLSSTAKAWQPMVAFASGHGLGKELQRVPAVPVVPSAPLQDSFQREAAVVIEEVRRTLHLTGWCLGAEFCWHTPTPGGGGNCRLTALITSDSASCMETLISAAKEAILAAAAKSMCVYVIGYKQAPFAAAPQGFSATLGMMTNEESACWDMYAKGFCKRCGQCQWQHPLHTVSFSFQVAMAAPQFDAQLGCMAVDGHVSSQIAPHVALQQQPLEQGYHMW